MSRGDFWSRRQAAVAAEAKAEEQTQAAAQLAAHEADLAEKSDDEILAALDLPTPESLSAGDDFKIFLTDQIPARIKTRALRHLWRANPVLACVDGLVDYGEDFTDAACVIEGLQSAYQVGKGMTKHVEALAQEAEVERLAALEELPEQGGETELVSVDAPDPSAALVPSDGTPAKLQTATPAPMAAPEVDEVPVLAEIAQAPEIQAPEIPISAAPRRMRFSFEKAAT